MFTRTVRTNKKINKGNVKIVPSYSGTCCCLWVYPSAVDFFWSDWSIQQENWKFGWFQICFLLWCGEKLKTVFGEIQINSRSISDPDLNICVATTWMHCGDAWRKEDPHEAVRFRVEWLGNWVDLDLDVFQGNWVGADCGSGLARPLVYRPPVDATPQLAVNQVRTKVNPQGCATPTLKCATPTDTPSTDMPPSMMCPLPVLNRGNFSGTFGTWYPIKEL